MAGNIPGARERAQRGELACGTIDAFKDNTGTVVSISDYISVNGAVYPMLQTYLLNATTNQLTKTGNFNSTDVLVLKIITKDTDSNILGVYIGDVELMSYTGVT